jgi:hypothetical protein
MNQAQRIAIFVASVLTIALIILHGPWDGYVTTGGQYGMNSLEFTEWRSKAPAFQWIGYINHIITSLIGIVFLLAVFLFLFRNSKNGEKD